MTSLEQFTQDRKEADKFLPKIHDIFNTAFGDCDLLPLRNEIKDEHILDKHFGIDCVLVRKCRHSPPFHISVQNKTYSYDWWADRYFWKKGTDCPNFCQEIINAYHTIYQRPGEWTTLTSQLILYAYRNKSDNDIERWYIMNALSYKLKIDKGGGLSNFGRFKEKSSHSRSAYYILSLSNFSDCIIDSYDRRIPQQQLNLGF